MEQPTILPTREELEQALFQSATRMASGSQFEPHSSIGRANLQASLLTSAAIRELEKALVAAEGRTTEAVERFEAASSKATEASNRVATIGFWLTIVATIATLIQAAPIVHGWLRSLGVMN